MIGKEKFHIRLRNIREGLALSHTHIGTAVGVDPTTIGNWEKGKGGPKVHQLAPLAEALGVSVDFLLTGEGESEGGGGASPPHAAPAGSVADRMEAIEAHVKALRVKIESAYEAIQETAEEAGRRDRELARDLRSLAEAVSELSLRAKKAKGE